MQHYCLVFLTTIYSYHGNMHFTGHALECSYIKNDLDNLVEFLFVIQSDFYISHVTLSTDSGTSLVQTNRIKGAALFRGVASFLGVCVVNF